MSRFALLVSLAAALAVSCGGEEEATSPTRSSTTQTATPTVGQEADRKRAEVIVLTDSDLEPEWTPFEGDSVLAGEIDCLQIEDDDLVLTAHVDGPLFSSGGPLLIAGGKVFGRASHALASHARTYETEEYAEAAFDRLVNSFATDDMVRCLFTAEETRKGPRMKGIRSAYIPIGPNFPQLADETWRQQFRITMLRDSTLIWIDLVVMRESRTLAILYSSSIETPDFMAPTSNEFVQESAETMAARIH